MNVKISLIVAYILGVMYYRYTYGPIDNIFVVFSSIFAVLAIPFAIEDENTKSKRKRGLL